MSAVTAGAERSAWERGTGELVVVRHGRTAHNAQSRLLGHLDPPLDDVGLDQAARLGAVVGQADLVVTSPLGRARETAAFIERADGVQVVVDERFIEVDYGELDGRPLADVPPAMWAQWRADPDFAPPGGESLASVGVRVAEACQDWAARADGRRIVVVTHVSPIKASVAWALGATDPVVWRMNVGQASVTRIGVSDRGPVLRSFNETGHLGPH